MNVSIEMKAKILLCLSWVAVLSLIAAPARAAELLSCDLTKESANLGDLNIWTGPTTDAWGRIAQGPVPEAQQPPERALVFYSSGTKPANFASSVKMNVPANAAKQLRFRIKFMVPVAGEYRVDLHFGGNWGSNAAIVVLQNGGINAWSPSGSQGVGEYGVGKWHELVVATDAEKKTCSLALDGRDCASGLPWNDPKLEVVRDLEIVADITHRDADGTPTLYVASIKVEGE